MAKRLPALQQATIPSFGRIDGGLLDGWTFAMLELFVEGRDVVLHVRATPPNWPFPQEPIELRKADFDRLANPNAAAKDMDVETLVRAALERDASEARRAKA